MARIPEHASGERTTLSTDSTAIVWFRRDLRVADHPALNEAVTRFARVACLYVIDDRLLHGRYRSPRRLAFLRDSLLALSAALEERGAIAGCATSAGFGGEILNANLNNRVYHWTNIGMTTCT